MTDSLSEIEDGSDLFYFESDHLAVKGNKEYSELVKTLFILQAQQQRAIKVIIQNLYKHLLYVVINRIMRK